MLKEVQGLMGHDYQIQKLNAMDQFHVARRIAPLWLSLGLSMGPKNTIEFDEVMAKIGPASFVLANMSDEDVDFVVGHCLNVVTRREGKLWAPVAPTYVEGKPQFMFQDMNIGVIFRLVYEVVRANLSNFTSELGVELPQQSS